MLGEWVFHRVGDVVARYKRQLGDAILCRRPGVTNAFHPIELAVGSLGAACGQQWRWRPARECRWA